MKFDIVIPVSEKHIEQLRLNLKYIRKNIDCDKIIIITNNKVINMIEATGVVYLNEDELIKGLTWNRIKDEMKKYTSRSNRVGWYFQQFLKMAYSFISKNEYYLVWDADTIPLKKISFFSDDETKVLFNIKSENNEVYFSTYKNLFGKDFIRYNGSFISEGMMINVNIMKQLINDIGGVNGFFINILKSIPSKEINKSGFSEFETYGTYLINNYNEKFQERSLNTLRNGMGKYGCVLDEKELALLPYDTISFEEWDKGIIESLSIK